ncbi:MAG: FecR family protein [Thermodesulfobacteriota bacterium]
MKYISLVVLSVVLALCRTPDGRAESGFVGTVKAVKPDAFLIRRGMTMTASAHMKIMIGDVVRTGANGSVGFILKDDTVISMGPDSEIVIDDFVFDPAGKKLSFIARLYHGTVAYISGQIAKLSPESVRFETPVATIGMRGTRFLVAIDKSTP